MKYSGRLMARKQWPITSRLALVKYVYSIKDNPYKGEKGVKWHNDFYDECKKIGRSVM